MKMIFLLAALASGLAAAPAANAEEAAPAAVTTPDADPSADEIQKYVKANAEIQKIQGDTALSDSDKQERIAFAVRGEGLSAQRFNEISEASRNDPELQKRLQLSPSQPE